MNLPNAANQKADNMTPSQQAKAAGLKNLAEVAQITGQSVQTLNNWFNDKNDLFNIVILGCSVSKHKQQIIDILK